MHKDFVNQLYYSSPDEVIKNYGGFVLTKFLSGGQATALYSGQYIEKSHDEDNQRETNLNTEISATINVQSGKGETRSSGNGLPYQSVLIGRSPGSSRSETNMFFNIRFSLRTLGGLPAYSQFTVPKDVNSTVFDISTWSKSLENPSNLAIAELMDESLIPISDFIEEDNLKEAFYAYYKNGLNSKLTYMQEPHIRVSMVYANHQFGIWETSLFTRYGEYVKLHNSSAIPHDQSKSYLDQEADRISAIFPGLQVLAIPNDEQLKGISRKRNQFDTSNMSKFTDSLTGKIYLLTTVPKTGEKLAYTLYDSRIVNDYVFENLINQLPVNNNVTLKSIRNQYRLIAL